MTSFAPCMCSSAESIIIIHVFPARKHCLCTIFVPSSCILPFISQAISPLGIQAVPTLGLPSPNLWGHSLVCILWWAA